VEEAEKGFVVEGNTLTANHDLYWESHDAFSEKCQELLNSKGDRLVVDLTRVNFMFSTYVGILGNLCLDAAERNKKLAVRISPRTEWIFNLAGFRQMIELQVVEGGGERKES
jgi:anti-anti-sigma factor